MKLSDTEEAIRMKLEMLHTNKLRTGLTMLGIMIAVTTVILVSAVVNGLTVSVDALVRSLGSNVFWIYRFPVFGLCVTGLCVTDGTFTEHFLLAYQRQLRKTGESPVCPRLSTPFHAFRLYSGHGGWLFGVYLARKASLLDPIVAWRSEL